jgi:hypothetical protein
VVAVATMGITITSLALLALLAKLRRDPFRHRVDKPDGGSLGGLRRRERWTLTARTAPAARRHRSAPAIGGSANIIFGVGAAVFLALVAFSTQGGEMHANCKSVLHERHGSRFGTDARDRRRADLHLVRRKSLAKRATGITSD